jgi:hypothetical protein
MLSKDLCLRPAQYGLSLSSSSPSTRRVSVLEFGSGTGLVGLVAARVLARQSISADVVLTDFHPLVLDNLKGNVSANLEGLEDASVDVGVRELDWEAVYRDSHESEPDELFDVCLGADIVYAPEHAAWLASCVRRFLRKPASDDDDDRPAMHLVIPLRPTHVLEVEAIREAFGETGESDDGTGWTLAILEEHELEREETVGRADETRYVRWRIGWKRRTA